MLAEYEFFFDANDIFLVFWVVVAKLFQDFGLNKTLFIESFLISQDFERHEFLIFMVKAFKHLTKTSFPKSICNLKPIANMLAYIGDVLILVIVEAVVVHAIWSRWWPLLLFSFIYIEPIYRIIVQYFSFFTFHQIFGEIYNRCAGIHWEFEFFLQIV